ncbi:MAG: glycoside hydrolase family 3 N-terminal domain-containing protein [Sphingomicrobium sp.]
MIARWFFVMSAMLFASCASLPAEPTADVRSTAPRHDVQSHAAAIVARMSLEHKISQLVMPDISTITPDDVATYRFGTILNGGNSGPGNNDKAPAPEWLTLADAMWDESMRPLADGEPVVPMLWATDAVHGHNNIPGATIFPHNVGLGATHDPALVRRIGEATAAEIAVTGIDWTFAPTIAVATDTRWGRAYESYGQDPAMVASLGTAMVEGLQGQQDASDFLDDRHVIATIKHFFGDGGTGGKDQGDTVGSLPALEAIHAAPYVPAIAAGAQSVMASFSSINGVKMHGNRDLLTDLLRKRMGFNGVVVGDWNGHGQIPGCTNTNCPQALLAGLDIYMVPEDWRALHATLVEQAREGTIPMARIDEAATRVVAMKLRAGAFERLRPSARPLGGKWDMLGAPAHRDLARKAVRESLVLLKNDGVLPLKASARILVAGKAADSIAAQAGGWSITWQGGGDLTNADFPGATSIYAGIAAAARAAGGTATLSPAGQFAERPDVAVVVFGEAPYAEFMGDRLDHRLGDEEGLALLTKFRAAGIRTVAILLSGRPLWMNRELAAADAFVAAWLPGSEGQGVADLILGDPAGHARFDFQGHLSFEWPSDCAAGSRPLFGVGYGASLARPSSVPAMSNKCAVVSGAPSVRNLFDRGAAPDIVVAAREANAEAPLPRWIGQSTSGALKLSAFDLAAQEDARTIEWTAPADLRIALGAPNLGPQGSVEIRFALSRAPQGEVKLSGDCDGCSSVDLASTLKLAVDKGYRVARVPLACLSPRAFSRLTLRAEGPVAIKLASLRIVPDPGPSSCQGPF